MFYEAPLPLRLGAKLEEVLPERKFKRQFGAHVKREGKILLRLEARRFLLVQDAMTLIKKLFELLRGFRFGLLRIFLEEPDVGLHIGFFVVGLEQTKNLLSDRQDIGPAVVILL